MRYACIWLDAGVCGSHILPPFNGSAKLGNGGGHKLCCVSGGQRLPPPCGGLPMTSAARAHLVDTFSQTVTIQRRTPRGYLSVGQATARIRLSQSKAGNSHSIVVPFQTDVRKGDHIVVRDRALEVLETSDLTGRGVFLFIEADAETATRSKRTIVRPGGAKTRRTIMNITEVFRRSGSNA